MDEMLFSYGTLKMENVQLKNFGRKLSALPDILRKYELRNCLIQDVNIANISGKNIHPIACFTGNPENSIPGVILNLTNDELQQADKYEVEAYKRVKCTLQSGKEAWVYVQDGLLIDTRYLKQGDIKLEVFQDKHAAILCEIASEPRIWQHHQKEFSEPKKFERIGLQKAKKAMSHKKRYMFVIYYKNDIVGSTSYYNVDIQHLRMHIGYTWMHPDYWGLGINKIVKQLMLSYAFEQLKFKRVTFCIDTKNTRSITAIKKLGIPFEGVLKKHQIRFDGSSRDSAVYAITDEVWNDIFVGDQKMSLSNHANSHQ